MRVLALFPTAAAAANLQAPRSVAKPSQSALFLPKQQRLQIRRTAGVRVQAARAWPDAGFIAETKRAFPGKGVADVEEARVLFSSAGYTYLDVRSEVEVEDSGKVRGSINVPIVNAWRQYSAAEGKKVLVQEPNREWISQVEARVRNRQAPLLVAGSAGGEQSTQEAISALKRAGYSNVVKLEGGYEAWSSVFDFKLNRRKSAGSVRPPPAQPARRPVEQAAAAQRGPQAVQAGYNNVRENLERTWSSSPVPRAQPQAPPQPTARPPMPPSPAGMAREWPNPAFVAETLRAFPDKAVADVEEAMALLMEGRYVFLDVRPVMELDAKGKVKNSVSLPYANAKLEFSPEKGQMVTKSEPIYHWIDQVQQRFPNAATPLLVCCTNGSAYAIDALTALEEAGYTNIVGLKGGYNAWSKVFDNKLNRRGRRGGPRTGRKMMLA